MRRIGRQSGSRRTAALAALAVAVGGCSGARPPRPATDAEAAEVAAVVQRQVPALRRCYEQALAGDPTLTAAIRVTFTLDAMANMTQLHLSGFGHARYFRQCVYWVFARAQFPPARGESTSFAFPFHFSPDAARDAPAESLGVPR